MAIMEGSWIKRLVKLKNIKELNRSIIVEMPDSITIYENNRIKIVYNLPQSTVTCALSFVCLTNHVSVRL